MPWRLAALPSLSVPAGRDADGLPTALQIIAAPEEDEALLRRGLMLESLFNFQHSPA